MEDAAALAGAGDELAAIEVEAPVEAEGADAAERVAEADAHRRPQVSEIDVAGAAVDVPGIDEPDRLEADDVDPQLAVQDDEAVAADGKTGRADRLLVGEAIEREAAHRAVAAGEEALARRQVVDFSANIRRRRAHEAARHAGARPECGDDAARRRQLLVDERLHERPDEADLRADCPRGD